MLLWIITWAISLVGADLVVRNLPFLLLRLLHKAPLAVEAVRVVAATASYQSTLALALPTDDRSVWILVHVAR